MLLITGAGPEREGEITVDAYIPLSIRWTWPSTHLWWRFVGPWTMLETGFHPQTAELRDVTLVQPGPITRVLHGPPAAAPVSTPGLPRCDPAEWALRSPRGAVVRDADYYVDDADLLRTELGPEHLLVRLGEDGEAAARELTCGRVRFGISAADGLLWICVDGFSAEARAALEEHAERSLAPAVGSALPRARGSAWWRRILPGG